jgi:hypothetical protein
MINAQQIIVIMIAYDIKPPAIATWFFNILFQIESVDVVPWSDFYEKYLKMEKTEPLSDNLNSLGYSNRYFIYNLGSSILPIAMLPILFVAWFLFSRCKFTSAVGDDNRQQRVKCFKFLFEKLEKHLFWNGTITTINETY